MVVVSPHGQKPLPSHNANEQPFLMTLLHRVGLIAVWGTIAVSVMSSMNASQPLGWILLVFVIIGALLLIASKQREGSRNKAAQWLLRIGIVGAALLPPLTVFKTVAPFALAGWALTGIYWAALIAGDWRSLSNFMRILSVLFGLALVIAVALVTIPGAAALTGEDKKHWTVKLEVVDPDSLPISNAIVNCLAVDFWDRNLTELAEANMTRVTDEHGEAEFEFTGARWLKAVVCGAMRSAQDFRPDLPLTKTIVPAPFSYLNTSAYITLSPASPSSAAADGATEFPQAAPQAPAVQERELENGGQDSTRQQTLDSSAKAERQAFLQAQQRQFRAEAERQAFLQAQQYQFEAQRQADGHAQPPNSL